MNKAILIGRLGKDAEKQSFQSGASVVKFTLATDGQRRDAQGNRTTDWHSIECWNLNDGILPYLTKGRMVAVDGSIRYDEYEKDGVKRHMTRIDAFRVELVGGGADSQQKQARPQKADEPQQDSFLTPDDMTDDLPF